MKKFLLLLLLFIGSAFGVRAQQSRYLGEVNLGFTYGPFEKRWAAVGIHTVHGARLGNHLYLGGGLGLEAIYGLASCCCDCQMPGCVEDKRFENGLVVPVYLNVKGFLNSSKPTTGYLTLDVGVVPHLRSSTVQASFYLCPAVGIKSRHFKADLGYKLINKFAAIQLRLGLFLGGGKYRK